MSSDHRPEGAARKSRRYFLRLEKVRVVGIGDDVSNALAGIVSAVELGARSLPRQPRPGGAVWRLLCVWHSIRYVGPDHGFDSDAR